MKIKDMQSAADQVCELMTLLSNRNRLIILCLLTEGEKSVGQLAQDIGARDTAVSQHLAVLRREKIVKARKHAQSVSYSLSGDDATKVMETLHDVFCGQVQD